MTLPVTERRDGPYSCNGVLVDFDFNFKVFTEDDIDVVYQTADGTETTLTLTTDYTVALNADQETNPGGTITTTDIYATGTTITVIGSLAYSQPTELTNRGGFFPKVIERAMDRLGILIQQLKELLERTLKAPASDDGAIDMTLPAIQARASKILGFDDTGAPTAYDPNVTVFSVAVDDFVATAGQTVFTLSRTYVLGVNAVAVYVNGVRMQRGVDYSETASNEITMSTGLSAGDQVEVVGGTPVTSGGAYDAATVAYTPAGTGAVATNVQTKLRESVSVKDFGAVGDGTTDDTAAIQAALTAGAAAGNAFVWLSPAATYKCASGLTIDTNKVGIIGNGATLSFATMTTGDALTVTQSNADANVRNYLNHAHPIDGVVFVGPGVATTTVRAVYLHDGSSPNTVSGVAFKNCGFVNFAKDVTFGSGAFCCLFDHCNFTVLSGTPSTYSIEVLTGTTNAGERNVFRDCMWNNRNYILNHTNAAADTYFNNCSIDGHKRAFTVTGGSVYVNGCHIETTDDTDYGFHVSGVNALIQIEGGTTQIADVKDSFSQFYSDSTCTQGGIALKNHSYFFSGATHAKPIIEGTGRADVSALVQYQGAVKPVVSSAQSALAYGGFESANYTAEWTLAGGTPAVRSNTVARTGTWSLSLPGAAGNTPSAYTLIPCLPGQIVNGEYWWQVPAITDTSGAFYVQCDFVDKAGNSIANLYGAALATTNVSTWTRSTAAINTKAPAGTTHVKLFFNIFGTASGAPIAYIDDVVLQAV